MKVRKALNPLVPSILLFFSFTLASELRANAESDNLAFCNLLMKNSEGLKEVHFVTIGAGDVVENHHMKDMIQLREDFKNTHKIIWTLANYHNPNETEADREKRLRVQARARENGIGYINIADPDEAAFFAKMRAEKAVIATGPGPQTSLIRKLLSKKNPPDTILVEKPFAKSIEDARQMISELQPDQSVVFAMDHYRPKMDLAPEELRADEAFLGGGIRHIDYYFTEDHSGADVSGVKIENSRDGAIEREGRVTLFNEIGGVSPDGLPHMFADVDYYGDIYKIRPVRVWAGRYRGVDGDPNKVTEVKKETFFATDFIFVDNHGNPVTGRAVMGKGLRTKEFGPEFEKNTKVFLITGLNGNQIFYDLRSTGAGPKKTWYNGDWHHEQIVKSRALEAHPYYAIFRAALLDQAESSHNSVSLEKATDFRGKEEWFAQAIGDGSSLPIYEGGMGGKNVRPAPYVEDLLARLKPVMAPKYDTHHSLPEPKPLLPAGIAAEYDMAIIGGAGVMGGGMTHRLAALNIGGLKIAVNDRAENAQEIINTMGEGAQIKLFRKLDETVASLKKNPHRKITILVTNQQVTESILGNLEKLLEPGDIIFDGGNDNFHFTMAWQKRLAEKGIRLLDGGVSGGKEGAWNGQAIMVGGDYEAWKEFAPLLQSNELFVDDIYNPSKKESSVQFVGPSGSGHFVKMVHNGIEYTELGLISEVFEILANVGKFSATEIKSIFDKWNKGPLESFLLATAAKVLDYKHPQSGEVLVNAILPVIGQKGTGKWASEAALDTHTYAPGLATAVFERFATEMYPKLGKFKGRFIAQDNPKLTLSERIQLVNDLEKAMYAARLISFVESMDLMKSGSTQYFDNKLDIYMSTLTWRAGSILVGNMLEVIHRAYKDNPDLETILDVPFIVDQLNTSIPSLAKVIFEFSGSRGIRTPEMYDLLSDIQRYNLPEHIGARLIAGIREDFGKHGFRLEADPTKPVHFDGATGQLSP